MTICSRCRRTYDDGVRFCPADGEVVTPVAEPASDPYLGKVLMGQFEITALAGRGAMGTVYRAEQTTMGRTVAVKILRSDLLSEPPVVKRFLREARASARLSHPNIVTVHLVGETDHGVPFIVMEYVDGGSLGALCEKEGVLSPRRAIHIARQIASALCEAHGHGIVHRDLKPENILLVDKRRAIDQVKVLDFGIAKIGRTEGSDTSGITRDGTIFGTPHYIAPEQAGGQEVDARADIYSLGVVLFRMVTGRLPFEGTSGMQVLLRHLREAPPKPRSIRPDVPIALEALILHALEKERSERIQDAERFLAGLATVEAGLGEDASRTMLGVAVPRGESKAASGRSGPKRDARSEERSGGQAAGDITPGASGSSLRINDARDRDPRADSPADSMNFPPDTTATVAPVDDLDDDELQPDRPRRFVLWGAIGVIALGLGIGLLYELRGGAPGLAADGGVAHASVDLGPPALALLFDEHVVSEGPLAMRLGFKQPPIAGGNAKLRVTVDGQSGGVSDARLEVTLRAGAGHDETIAAWAEPGVAGAYLADVEFHAAGRHHLVVVATPRVGTPVRSAFDFDVTPAHSPVPLPIPLRERPRRDRRSATGAPAKADDEAAGDQLDPVVIPPSSPSIAPVKPHGLGPGPGASLRGPESMTGDALLRTPQPAVATPISDESSSDSDPYKILDHR